MPQSSPVVSNFSSGEWSPRLYGRVDVAKYFNGAEELENILVDQYGGAFRRPGTYFVIETLDSTKKPRIIAFQFSTTQAYIIEFGNQYVRFFKDGGAVLESTKAITAATKANPCVITSASHGYSNGDVVYISGVVGMTQLNGRFFTVANVATNTFELSGVNSTAYTTYVSGGTVARVYKISTPYLEADLYTLQYAQSADVMYLVHPSYAPRKLTRTAHTSWTLSSISFINGPYLDTNTTAVTLTPGADTGTGVTLTASASTFQSGHVGSSWRVKSGWVTITGYTSATVVTVTITGNLGTGPGATTDWAEGAWSAVRGYPSCVTFFGQRLWFAATSNQPQTLWGSKVAAFETFTAGTSDGDPITATILSEQVNAIRWLSPQAKLIIGTVGGDFDLSSGTLGEAVTPTNVTINGGTTYGSANVLPKRIGSFVYYMQRNTRTVRELSYNINIDNRQALDMTLLAEHITESGIVEMDYAQSPNNVLWCVREDGTIATMTRQIDQEVIAWTRQVTDGLFESVAIIPSQDETYDEVWFVVKRTINGSTKRYIEYMKSQDFGDDQADCFFVDCGLTYSGVAATNMGPLHHLEAKSVQVLADGAVAPNGTVESGYITLASAAEKAQIGLQQISTITTLRQEGGSALGTSQGKQKRIYELVLRFYKTLGCKVGNKTTQDRVQFRTTSMPMSTAPALFSGDKTITPPGDFDKDGQLCIIQDQPLPLGLLAMFPKIYVGDK